MQEDYKNFEFPNNTMEVDNEFNVTLLDLEIGKEYLKKGSDSIYLVRLDNGKKNLYYMKDIFRKAKIPCMEVNEGFKFKEII